ncbi:hypothetical protein KTS45_12505 [Halomicroarcula limicola]|uniref:Uncharacterized protein n=1 Tax=Haloarcula limicola TaxID=1429915 RepID=A0A8J8C7F4_9EURY|nr:hypothetical protein [Halomicroarcula limicola]MBV0925018.1 hypothetical protein [Halomicroarcula limicola]
MAEDWISKLKPLAKEGPETFVMRRIVQFVIGAAVGVAFSVADGIAWITDQFQVAITFSAGQFGAALLPDTVSQFQRQRGLSLATYGDAVINWMRSMIAALVEILGPAAGPVLVIVTVVLLALGVRVVRALADSVPVISGIQTLLEGK